MIRHILLLLLLVILALGVSASSQYMINEGNEGFEAGETGSYSDATITTIQVSEGSQFQPLIADLNGDGVQEIVVSNNGVLNVYNVIGTSLVLMDNLNFNDTQRGNFQIIEGYDDDGLEEFIVLFGKNVSVLQYNGSDILLEVDARSPSFPTTGAVCKNFTASNLFACYWGGDLTNITEFNPITGGISNIDLDLGNSNNAFRTATYYNPAIGDIDRDGNDEIIFIYDDNGDLNEGIAVFDQNQGNLDSSFNGNGILDNIGSGGTILNYEISGILVSNIDGGGDPEIVTVARSNRNDGTDELEVRAFRSNANQVWEFNQGLSGSAGFNSNVSAPAIHDVIGDSAFEICFAYETSTITSGFFRCLDTGTGTSLLNVNRNFSVNIGNNLLLADMTADSKSDFILGNTIYDAFNDELILYGIGGGYFLDIGDVNNDNLLDVCAMREGTTFCAISGNTNLPPVLNDSQLFGGYGATLDYNNPICVNTTITFSAQECGGIGTCNFDNDILMDQERIVSNCGQGVLGEPISNLLNGAENGTFVGSNPTFSCFYNLTGTYTVGLFLQDDANPTDLTERNNELITVNVIQGTAGVECNLGSIGTGTTETISVGQPQTDQAIEDTLGILFGSSIKMRLLIGFTILIFLIVGVGRTTDSPIAIAMVGVSAVFFNIFFGLFPFWVGILLIIGMIATFFVKTLVFPSSNGGG